MDAFLPSFNVNTNKATVAFDWSEKVPFDSISIDFFWKNIASRALLIRRQSVRLWFYSWFIQSMGGICSWERKEIFLHKKIDRKIHCLLWSCVSAFVHDRWLDNPHVIHSLSRGVILYELFHSSCLHIKLKSGHASIVLCKRIDSTNKVLRSRKSDNIPPYSQYK